MKKADFLRIVGAGEGTEYTPVAGMLRSGYGFAGYFNDRLNEDLDETLVLVNVRLVDIHGTAEPGTQPRISNFNDFVEEIVLENYQSAQAPQSPRRDIYGKSVPLAAIPFDEVAVVYPVSQIGKMMRSLHREQKKIPNFLDFGNKSLILKILRTKLW